MSIHLNLTSMKYGLAAILLGLSVTIHSNSVAANFDSGVFEFQQKLANGGNAQAQYKLATMYENGRGINQDLNTARSWYEKSAAQKYRPAQHRLTYLEVKSNGFKAEHKPWLNELMNDAKKGNAEALYLVGELYENGTGVKQNHRQAAKMYKSASRKGHVEAETRLFAVEAKIKSQDTARRERAAKNREAEEARKAEEAKKAAEKKRAAENERKARQSQAEKNRTAQQQQQAKLKAERERQRLIAERQRLEAERRKLEEAQKALNAQKAKEAAVAATKEEDEKFESDLCSGRAAQFRTQCK